MTTLVRADPILAYSAGAQINQLQWSTSQPDWVAINFGVLSPKTLNPERI
jgi:hypothetical protein